MAVLRMTHIGICVTDLDAVDCASIATCSASGRAPSCACRARRSTRCCGCATSISQAVYLERDGTRIELLHYVAPGAVGDGAPRPMNGRGLTHLSLRVDGVHGTLARAARAGGRVLDETLIDIPDFGAAAVFITDPDGTLIELVQSPGDPEAPPGG